MRNMEMYMKTLTRVDHGEQHNLQGVGRWIITCFAVKFVETQKKYKLRSNAKNVKHGQLPKLEVMLLKILNGNFRKRVQTRK